MFWDLFNTSVFILAGLLLYRFGPRFLAALKRFDDANRLRIEQERADRSDANAHFRHAIEIADEQVEDVTEMTASDMRTGTPVKLYLFEGESFADRAEAERARARKIYDKAHRFYLELPVALGAHRSDDKLK
jgi:hypothetical protein